MAAGKYYWEITIDSASNAANLSSYIGIATSDDRVVSWPDGSTSTYPGQTAGSWAFFAWGAGANSGKKTTNAGAPASYYDTTISVGDVVGVAYDADNGAIWISINDSWIDGNGSDSSATVKAEIEAGTVTSAMYSSLSGTMYPVATTNGTTMQATCNFGTSSFTGSEPTNFTALNTTNIAEATTRTVSDPYKHWANCLYDGTGAALDITIANETPNGSTFDPEFVWTKNRDQDDEHKIVDIVRGATKELNSDSTNVESTDANGVTSITSTDKYVLGTGAGGYNDSGEAFVGWAAKLGGAAVSNTDGSLTSQVSVNNTLGMSVITWTNDDAASNTVGHGLATEPELVIAKSRDNTHNWVSWHSGLSGGDYLVYLNLTNAEEQQTTRFTTAPASGVLSLGSWAGFDNTEGYMAICFAPSEFISIGSYTGNGSTDGTFTPLLNSAGIPLSPIWHINKRADSTSNWYMFDKARDPYNPTENILQAAGTDVEAASDDYDHVNGGIKLRNSSASHNQSGGDYVYITIGIPVIDKAGRILTAR
jgi:hypothetical protein